jgi:hypothetical protein
MSENILCCFSGGRSSAYMAFLLKYHAKWSGKNVKFVFANTGQEHEKTLEFINKCDKEFALNIIWIEAVTYQGERRASGYKIVNYETACRDGRLFDEIIQKYGMVGKASPHCTNSLKVWPINSYMKSIGWDNFKRALGIRYDEPKRLKSDDHHIFPLNELEIDKADVLEWWKEQNFDLEIEEHQGNCVWCWKKSDKKHFININEHPEWYEVPRLLEEKYSEKHGEKNNKFKPDLLTETLKEDDKKYIPATFFRGHRSTLKMIELAKKYGIPDKRYLNKSDEDGGCSESCEAFQENLFGELNEPS